MTDVFEPGANKTEGLALISLFQLVDSFYGLFIKDVTADAVMGVGWIDYDAALRQDVDRLLNQSTLRVDWIYLNQHRFTIYQFVSEKARPRKFSKRRLDIISMFNLLIFGNPLWGFKF
jgi:hypothetical protein